MLVQNKDVVVNAPVDATVFEAAFAKAIAHPIRLRALEILNERTESPSSIARELELPVANVSYHVLRLLQLGVIEEAETRHVRGAIEHRYRAKVRPSFEQGDMDALTPSEQRAVAREAVRVIAGDLLSASSAGDFTRERAGEDTDMAETHLSISGLQLDVEGWDYISGRLRDVLDEAHAVQAAAQDRLANGEQGGRAVAAHVVMGFYERERPGLLPGRSGA
jgi:DNA-binding transcriptional ArsR family regulator